VRRKVRAALLGKVAVSEGNWIFGGFAEIVSQFAVVLSSNDTAGSDSGQSEERSTDGGNPIREAFAEIRSQIAGVFSDDVSNSQQVQEISTTNQERGKASHNQGKVFEGYTAEKLEELGLNAIWHDNLYYDETFEEYGKPTQVEVTIDDDDENEVAIVECKSYGPNSRLTGEKAVDQVKRLVHVAKERGINLVFSTADGSTDCFGSDVMEVLNENHCFVISPDQPFFADPSDVKENGVTEGLPPDLRDHWNWFGTGSNSDSEDSSDYSSSDSDRFDNGYESESNDSYESSSSDSYDSVDSDSGDSGGSWDLFGDSYDSGASDSYDSSSSDSDSDSNSDSSSSSSDS